MACVRYALYANATGFTNNSAGNGRLMQSGKLIATGSGKSTIITIPPGPDRADLRLYLFGAYADASAKTGHGFAFVTFTEDGSDPAPGGAEGPIDPVPRIVIQPPMPQAASISPAGGFTAIDVYVRSGMKFCITDAGWAV